MAYCGDNLNDDHIEAVVDAIVDFMDDQGLRYPWTIDWDDDNDQVSLAFSDAIDIESIVVAAETASRPITLADLERVSLVVAIRRLAIASGMEPETLKSRIRRGTPELTQAEAQTIVDAMQSVGITVTTGPDAPNNPAVVKAVVSHIAHEHRYEVRAVPFKDMTGKRQWAGSYGYSSELDRADAEKLANAQVLRLNAGTEIL
jgi:hypothetical protein